MPNTKKMTILDHLKRSKQFFRYCVVGVAGTAIDLGSLYAFVEFWAVPVLLATVFSFLLAVTNNYFFNKVWTFENKSKNTRKLYIKFLLVSLAGLGLTVLSMALLVNFLGMWYMLAKAITSVVVLTWNFLANKWWTFRIKKKAFTIPKTFPYDLSIIIPAYNEENRIKSTLLSIIDYLEEKALNAEIIVVNDGSTDKTVSVAKRFKKKHQHLRIISLEKNSGKGVAVKKGIEASQGKYILFTDADNSTPIEEFEKLKRYMEDQKADIAIGSRYLRDSDVRIKQPRYRIFLGRVGNLLIQLFLMDGVKDTQCGFKLFTHACAQEIFAFQKVQRFAFDMEALVIAKHLGYSIVEVPISWFNSPESRVRPIRDASRTLRDLVYIKLNLWCGRYTWD